MRVARVREFGVAMKVEGLPSCGVELSHETSLWGATLPVDELCRAHHEVIVATAALWTMCIQ